jgi:hypothetical protein
LKSAGKIEGCSPACFTVAPQESLTWWVHRREAAKVQILNQVPASPAPFPREAFEVLKWYRDNVRKGGSEQRALENISAALEKYPPGALQNAARRHGSQAGEYSRNAANFYAKEISGSFFFEQFMETPSRRLPVEKADMDEIAAMRKARLGRGDKP